MEETVEQFMMSIIYAIIAITCISIISMSLDHLCLNDLFIYSHTDAGNHFKLKDQDYVIIQLHNNQLEKNSEFNPMDYIDLYYSNTIKNELKQYVDVYGYVNTSISGEYPVTYVIRYNDIVSRKEVNFIVSDESHI